MEQTKSKQPTHRPAIGPLRPVHRSGGHRRLYPDPGAVFRLFHPAVLFCTAFRHAAGEELWRVVGGDICPAGPCRCAHLCRLSGGIGYVIRPSFGYLLGFIVAAFVTGFLAERLKSKSFSSYLAAALGGFVVTYAIGLTYKYCILNFVSDTPATWAMVFLSCFPLDMPGDLLLCAAAAFVGSRMNKALKGRLSSC